MSLQTNIKRLRETKALSQRELAAIAGLNTATINRIECGRHNPHPRTIRKIAKALEVRPEDLMSEQLRLI